MRTSTATVMHLVTPNSTAAADAATAPAAATAAVTAAGDVFS